MKAKVSTHLLKLAYSALFLAVALVLPLVTANIPRIGVALAPMHIPVMLCGFICGWPWGLTVGVTAPILRSVLFGMPLMFPSAVGMASELGMYGFLCGFLFLLLPEKLPFIYLDLAVAMIGGRLLWGCVRYGIAGLSGSAFGLSEFWAGAVANAVPGMIIQLILIPPLVMLMKKGGYLLNGAIHKK